MMLHMVTGHSMAPRLPDGTWFVVRQPRKRALTRGRIVTFDAGTPMVKRIIGCPGDVVELRGRSVFVNGRQLLEPYIIPPNEDYGHEQTTLCAGEYYVLGDNRPNSVDSRFFGPVRRSEIKGVMMFSIRRKGDKHVTG